MIEYYPQDDWSKKELIKKEIPSSQLHVLRIEHRAETVEFYINGELIHLEYEPSLPVRSKWEDWHFEGFLAGPENELTTLETYVDWVAVKLP